jgi:DNA-directed RNA polymerase specialized sigma24 family protein
MALNAPWDHWTMRAMVDNDASRRADDDVLLEAAYRAEFSPGSGDPDERRSVGMRTYRVGELRARAMDDLATRIAESSLLRRADDTARVAALRFVERRLTEADKITAYDQSGSFHGFLRRVLSNLLLDWLRSPTGTAELRRAEHDGSERFDVATEENEPELPSEQFDAARRLTLHHLIAVRTLQMLPPGRGIPLRLALWPAYEHEAEDLAVISAFAHCHETSDGQAGARACDSGKRCTTPTEAWRTAHKREIAEAKASEKEGLSRRSIAVLTRIGHDKPMPKREGAICERVSKARLMLVAELRRAGVRGANS